DISMEMRFFGVCTATSLTAALNQAYLDYYYDENVYNEVKGFISIVKEKYKGLIEANENLSDTSKEALYEKLDKMRENVILPSNKADFTDVDFKTKEDGGSILDIMCDLYRIENEHVGEMTGTHVPRGFWDIYDSMESTTLTGATYDMRENAIYIKLGILVEPMYSANATIEQKLGSFVSVLGHEISHAFDTEGIKYDADGKLRTVVSTKEMTNWLNVIAKIGNHFDGYSPFEGSGEYENSGIRLSSEVIADAEGLKVAMMIAKDYEKFDYDLFFRSYAVFWRCLEPKQDQMRSLVKDTHPLEYLRINYTLAQFDEFVETYGIKKSNGMYMDPSERILIW
ncbi:MAG: hypothetical protein J5777_05000, partial [Clostridiales bacterium]|nr:hypothetical protein [Clostridiales bacterium]